MISKYNKLPKSLGKTAAHLVLTLYERNRPIFLLKEAQDILGKNHSAPRILHGLVERGIISRLKPGIYRLIPFELGFEREYLGNPFIVAREIAMKALSNKASHQLAPDYYISHGSAFELHQMATQPLLMTFVSCPRLIRSLSIQGNEFRFIRCKPKDLFGLTELWVDKAEKVQASDLERSLIDGLKQPHYCGGLTEVAKAFFIKRTQVNPDIIIEYAIRSGIGAVIRRLGFIMETYEIGSDHELSRLHKKITPTYHLLDPDLEARGSFLSKWKLRLNVTREELLALKST